MLQQLSRRKLKTVAAKNEKTISDPLKEIKTGAQIRCMLGRWITLRHTLPACATK
jgi:hypothetical protein